MIKLLLELFTLVFVVMFGYYVLRWMGLMFG